MSGNETEKETGDESAKAGESPGTGAEGQKKEEIPEGITLPPANLSSLVMMLSTTALGYLAELEKCEAGKKNILIQLARHTIDTIQVIDEKTKGNLQKEEKALIDTVLADLRLQFIKYAN